MIDSPNTIFNPFLHKKNTQIHKLTLSLYQYVLNIRNEYNLRGKISSVFQICFSVVQNFGNCASGSKLLLKCRNETGSNWLLQGPEDIIFCFKFLQRSLIWKSENYLFISF